MWSRVVDRGTVHAGWQAALKAEEKERLAVLERRLTLKMQAVEDLLAERRKIMRRAIARRRRARPSG